jgi:hypothetical protein
MRSLPQEANYENDVMLFKARRGNQKRYSKPKPVRVGCVTERTNDAMLFKTKCSDQKCNKSVHLCRILTPLHSRS